MSGGGGGDGSDVSDSVFDAVNHVEFDDNELEVEGGLVELELDDKEVELEGKAGDAETELELDSSDAE